MVLGSCARCAGRALGPRRPAQQAATAAHLEGTGPLGLKSRDGEALGAAESGVSSGQVPGSRRLFPGRGKTRKDLSWSVSAPEILRSCCMCPCVCARVPVWVRVHVCLCVCTCASVRVHVCPCVCTCACVHVCTWVMPLHLSPHCSLPMGSKPVSAESSPVLVS